MALTDTEAQRLRQLEALLPWIAAECRTNIEHIDRVIEASNRRMAPYEPVFRRIEARLARAGYRV